MRISRALVSIFICMIVATPSAFAAEKVGAKENAVDLKDIELDTEEMSAPRYIGGGVLAIVPGFGLGHVVQGRYRRGIGFAAAPFVVFYGLWIGGTLACGAAKPNPDCDNVVSNIALATFVSVKAWEIFDAWAVPEFSVHPLSARNRIKPFLFADPRGVALAGLNFSF